MQLSGNKLTKTNMFYKINIGVFTSFINHKNIFIINSFFKKIVYFGIAMNFYFNEKFIKMSNLFLEQVYSFMIKSYGFFIW